MSCKLNPTTNPQVASVLHQELMDKYNEEIADNIYAKVNSKAFIKEFGNWINPTKEEDALLAGRIRPEGREPWLKYNETYNYHYFELANGDIFPINHNFINLTDEQKQALLINSIQYLSGNVLSKEDLGTVDFRDLYKDSNDEGKINLAYHILDREKSALRELEDEIRVFYNISGRTSEQIYDDSDTRDASEKENDRNNIVKRDSIENNSKDNASSNIKFMFSYIPKYNADGTRKQINFNVRGRDVAIQDYMTYHEIWNYFEETLANILPTVNGDSFVDTYQQMVNSMYEKYGEGSQFENNSVKDALTIVESFPDYKKAQFVLAFMKSKVNFYTTTIDNSEVGKIHLTFFNSGDVTSRTNKIKKEITSGIQRGSLVDNIANTYDKDLAIKVNNKFKELQKLIREENPYSIEDSANYLRILLKEVGINLNTPSLINYIDHQDINYEEVAPNDVDGVKLHKAFDKLKFIFKDLADAKDVFVKGKYNNPLTMSTPLEDIAKAEAEFRKDIQENTVTGPDNKTYWSYSAVSYLNLKLNDIRNDINNSVGNSGFYRNSTWIKRFKENKAFRDTFEVLNFLNLKLADQGDAGVDNKEINIQDQTVDTFNKAVAIYKQNKGEKYSIINTPVPAGKSQSRSFKLDKGSIEKSGFRIVDGKYEFSQDLKDVYKGYLVDEYSRIVELFEKVTAVKSIEDALETAKKNKDKSEISRLENRLDIERESLYQNFHYGKNQELFKEFDGKLVPAGNGFKFSLFEELNYDQKLGESEYRDLTIFSLADDTDIITPATTIEELMSSHVIDELIQNKLEQHLDSQLKTLEEFGLVTFIKDKGIVNSIQQNNFIDEDILNHYQGLHDNNTEAILDFIFESSINQHKANVEYSKMFSGDYAFYKNLDDYSKRVPATYTDGIAPVLSPTDPINYTMAVGPEVVIDTDLYKKVDVNDAQGYITFARWKFLVRRLNKFSPKVDDIIERFEQGNPLPDDYKFAAQPLKGVYFNNKEGIPTFVKYSAYVLLEDVTGGDRNIDNLRKQMEAQGIDEFVALSGVKAGAVTTSDVFDADNNYKPEMKFYKQSLSNHHWKKQQDLSPKGIKQTLLGSQMQWNIIGDLIKNKTYNGKTGKQRIDAVNNLVSELSNMHFNNLVDSIGLNVTTGDIKYREKFHELLLTEIQRNGGDKNSLEALKKQYPLDVILSNRTKYQNIISAVINSASVGIKTNGGSFIQASSLGWQKDKAIDKSQIKGSGITMLVDVDKLEAPKRYTDKDGNKRVKPGQVFMTHNQIAKFIPNYRELAKEGKLNKIINDKLRYIVGYRIPNQDFASNDALEIVGILPESMGDTVLPYLDITTKTGSDFDIDKMYLMMPNIKPIYNVKKKIQDALFNKPTDELIRYLQNNDWNLEDIATLTRAKTNSNAKKGEIVQLIYETSPLNELIEFTGLTDIKVDKLDYYQDQEETVDNNIEVVERYTVKDVKLNPMKVFVFGDNLQRVGKGGQAQIRDEENAFGIATKLKPSNSSDAFMSDDNLIKNKAIIDKDIKAIKAQNKQVVFPKDGLGTGLAKLKEKAPLTYQYLQEQLLEKFGFNNDTGAITKVRIKKNRTIKGVENELLQEFIDLLTADELFDQLKQSIDNPLLKDDIKFLFNLDNQDVNQFDFFSPTAQLQKKFDNSAGKAGTGIMSNNRVDLVKAQIAELSMNEDLGVGWYKDGVTRLDQIEGTDGVRISEMISLFLTAYVDIEKDPYITKGNHNTVTANTSMLLLRAGTPLKWINRFVGQEGIFRYAYLESNKKSKFNPKKGDMLKATMEEYWDKVKELRGDNKFDEFREEVEEKIQNLVYDGEKIRNHKKFKEGYMEDNIMNTPETIDDKITYNLDQIMYLKAYERYSDLGTQLNNTVVYSKADVNGAKPTYMENLLYQQGYDKMFQATSRTVFDEMGPINLFNNLQNKFTDTMLGTKHRNSVDVVDKIFEKELVTASKFAQLVYEAYQQNHPYATNKELKALEGQVFGYMVSKSDFFNNPSTHSMTVKDLTSDRLQNKVRELRSEYPDNALLNALEFETVEGFHFLKLENFKNKPITFKNDLIQGWQDLHEVNTEFSEDLIKYTFITSNFQFNSNTFFEFIPYNLVKELLQPVTQEFKINTRHDQLEEFFNFQARHNVENVPDVKLNMQNREDEVGLTNYKPNLYGDMLISRKQSSSYIKHDDGFGNVDLYKLVGETNEEDVNLYIKVSKLGFKKKGYTIFEHNLPKGSIIQKNRVPYPSVDKSKNIVELLKSYGYRTEPNIPLSSPADFYTGAIEVTEEQLKKINKNLGVSYTMESFQKLNRTQKETLIECHG